jgi:hypothetical protein
MSIVQINVPGPSASRSKMQKKGWKCWAKLITSIAEPAKDGYSWAGEFLTVGAMAECENGSLLLHVDDSSSHGVGVIVQTKSGKSRIVWMAGTSSRWATALARTARTLLAMTCEERIRAAAKARLAEIVDDASIPSEVRQYWEALAGQPEMPAENTAPAFDAASIAEQIKGLLAGLTDDQVAEVYRLLPGVEHTA